MTAVLFDGPDRCLEVARIVERIENTENVDSVLTRERHEPVDDVVGVVAVPNEVLPAQKHLQRRVFGA